MRAWCRPAGTTAGLLCSHQSSLVPVRHSTRVIIGQHGSRDEPCSRCVVTTTTTTTDRTTLRVKNDVSSACCLPASSLEFWSPGGIKYRQSGCPQSTVLYNNSQLFTLLYRAVYRLEATGLLTQYYMSERRPASGRQTIIRFINCSALLRIKCIFVRNCVCHSQSRLYSSLKEAHLGNVGPKHPRRSGWQNSKRTNNTKHQTNIKESDRALIRERDRLCHDK